MANGKVLVTGASGMLGQDLVPHLKSQGYSVFGATSTELNLLRELEEIQTVVKDIAPDIIVHSAAMTNVDQCETSPELAMAINKDGTQKLALAAESIGAKFVYISTDYVFDGNTNTPYLPGDRPNPINVYGMSKYYGELMAQELVERYYIVRTSWLYGLHRNNFVQFVIEQARQGQEIRAIEDQVGSPTWTGSLSRSIQTIMESDQYGIYHGVDAGMVNRVEQAQTICKKLGLSPDHVQPVSWKDMNFSAPRPNYTVMGSGSLPVPLWETSLEEYLDRYMNRSSAGSPS